MARFDGVQWQTRLAGNRKSNNKDNIHYLNLNEDIQVPVSVSVQVPEHPDTGCTS